MSYIKVKNPLDVEVKTGYKGEYFTLQPGETKSLPQGVAEQFTETYGFLELVAEEEVKEVVKETPKEVVEKKVVKK